MEIKIAQLERTLPNGVVTIAHWTATKTSGDFVASSYGSIALPTNTPESPTFVPYENITETVVIDWVLDAMGEEQVTSMEAGLDAQLDILENPQQARGIPWSNNAIYV